MSRTLVCILENKISNLIVLLSTMKQISVLLGGQVGNLGGVKSVTLGGQVSNLGGVKSVTLGGQVINLGGSSR